MVENQHDMEDHYTQAAQGRDALIRGDLDGMHTAMSALVKRLPLPALPPELHDKETTLHEAVLRAQIASDLESGAAALVEVAAACGGCHSSAGVDPIQLAAPPPAEEMRSHHWAAARMWDGLIGGSDAALAEGFGALSQISEFDEGAIAATATPFAGDLTLLAERAASATAEGRRAAYGEYLESCAACHALTGGGPK